MVKWFVIFALAIAGASACTLLDSDPPDDTCSSDNDCFRAQGEKCVDNRCQVMARDAGVDSQ